MKRPTFCYELRAAEHVGSLTLDRLRPGSDDARPAALLNSPALPALSHALPALALPALALTEAWGPVWRLAAQAGLSPHGPLVLPGPWSFD